ncbi:SWIM zinc finger family protein, partial [candidate division WOR-3 bacterium]|nr:SWIM zinc finger family protein [candidate division WOR-3 bacterium]
FTSNRFYTVVVDKRGNYACTCKWWKYRREQCRHIQHVIDSNMKPDEEENS